MMMTFEAMNTQFLLAGLTPAKEAETRTRIQMAQKTFSRFDPASEITAINQQHGQWVAVSPLTFQLLQDAAAAYEETDGLFNAWLGETLENLGYDKSFEKLRQASPFSSFHPPGREPPPRLLSARALRLDEKRSLVSVAPEASLDLGGIAKGWIAQYACDQLQLTGTSSGLIDAGGDIILWGQDPENVRWGVGIAHPLGQEEDIADLWCEGTVAIATSSILKRRWQAGGQNVFHHIIDPRTRLPADSDLVQATVLSRDLTVAEQYAKCLLILGSVQGIPWLRQKRPDLAFITVCNDGRILRSDNLQGYCPESEVLSYVQLQ